MDSNDSKREACAVQIAKLASWASSIPASAIPTEVLSRGARVLADDLAAIIKTEKIDFVQTAYAPDVRAAEERLLSVAQDHGVAVIVNRPFSGGSLFTRAMGKPLPDWAGEIGAASWGQVFLKYLIGHPAVTCVIPGTARPEHKRDSVGAGIGPLPDAAQRRRMAQWWDAQ